MTATSEVTIQQAALDEMDAVIAHAQEILDAARTVKEGIERSDLKAMRAGLKGLEDSTDGRGRLGTNAFRGATYELVNELEELGY